MLFEIALRIVVNVSFCVPAEIKILVSSAKRIISQLFDILPKSFMYIRKSKGSKLLPCSTKYITRGDSDVSLRHIAVCFVGHLLIVTKLKILLHNDLIF